jgi:hypothetical protein
MAVAAMLALAAPAQAATHHSPPPPSHHRHHGHGGRHCGLGPAGLERLRVGHAFRGVKEQGTILWV